MPMKIAVVGTGYVGLTTCVGLADFGNHVVGVDIDREKVARLSAGDPVIYEAGLEYYLRENLAAGRLSFTTSMKEALRDAEVVFLAVGTPEKENGEADLSQIEAVLEELAPLIDHYLVVVTKSTVPVGTNRWIHEELSRMVDPRLFDVVSNPEFLREGKAIQDFFHPNRVVIGYENERVKEVMHEIYRPLYLIETPFVWCSWETAELIKYAANAFLATKISFINQVANLAEEVGADVHVIAKAMGMDGRISPKFLHPGPGFGGSCFPKDTKALVKIGERYGVDLSLVREVIRANEAQRVRMVEKAKRLLGGSLEGRRIAVLGLAFKAETDDVRETPAYPIIRAMLEEGAVVCAHDPLAMENFRRLVPSIEYAENEYEAARGADLVLICTEWNEYRNLDLERVAELMRERKILDTRNVLDPERARKTGFVYEGVGRILFRGKR
ncbi:UDP-glucose dehydrogenase family protein [Spirochaeta thermophila]|uniref:UDP-glucose 6-dehydrogenase n=1 Tax=Winmispira thermophila (strain ATCC 49972 / DSM 6192 / RI 19.B1) TaxID=665571 RepID=E0RTC1_WINT6|nr:UDP-glucose/GDP-mannose dehydrogenase family protein [Spirochaeta thermophila]ADN00987.1 UDP-glucose 6-dehydrogenase [Spirochaeta thermophila DSM 6192]